MAVYTLMYKTCVFITNVLGCPCIQEYFSNAGSTIQPKEKWMGAEMLKEKTALVNHFFLLAGRKVKYTTIEFYTV